MYNSIDDSVYKETVSELSKFTNKDKIYNLMIQFIERNPTFPAIVDFFITRKITNWTKKEWNNQIWRRLWISSKIFHVSIDGSNYKLTKWGVRHANLESKLDLSNFTPNSYLHSKKFKKGLEKELKKREINEDNENLLENLRALRDKIAKESKISPYLLLTDKTLIQLSKKRPSSLKDIESVKGFGEVKSKKFGKLFLDKIRDYDGTLSQSEEKITPVISEIPVEISSNNDMLDEVIPLLQTETKVVKPVKAESFGEDETSDSKEFQTVAIVDGSNVVYSQQPWKLSTLIEVKDKLSEKYDKVDIICDASLRHQFVQGSQDREEYEKLLREGDFQQSPAGREADFFILKWVNNYIKKNKQPCIISNDLFRDYHEEFAWLKTREYQKNFMLQDFGDEVELVLT